ncbi:hypothetical protein GTO27_02845 [Candidatus Bathyarchaeota archaeon]|nr:hypothetical protein [Candidatus Bathyarchaeota archaeon]
MTSSVVLIELKLKSIIAVQLCEECVSVIVTGNATGDGRAILMKNRDTGDVMNSPVYHPSAGDGT